MTGPPSNPSGREIQPQAAGRGEAAAIVEAAAHAHSPWRNRIVLALKLAVAVAIVIWLNDSGQLRLSSLVELRLSPALVLLFVLTIFSLGLPVWRWWWLLKIQNLPVAPGTALRLSWLGYFCALFLPGAASGDAVKAYLIVRGRPAGRFRAVSTVVVDRFLGLYSLLFLAAIPLAWHAERGDLSAGAMTLGYTTLMLWLGGTAGLLLICWSPTRRMLLAVFPARWHEVVDDSWALYRANLPGLAGCFAISLVIDVVAVLSFSAAAAAYNQSLPWDAAFLAGPLAVMANGIPLTPGGAGVGEVASLQLFKTLNLDAGADAMLLVRVVSLVVTLPAAVLRWHAPPEVAGVDHLPV